jgi:hypothetical protein
MDSGGQWGCNDYFADYTTDEGAITIGDIGVTFRMCTTPNGVMEQEAEFLAALQSAATYTVEGNFLEMRNAKDAIAVQMTRNLDVTVPEPEPNVPTGRDALNGVNVRSGPGQLPDPGTARHRRRDHWAQRRRPLVGCSRALGARWHGLGVGGLRGRDRCRDVPVIASPPPPVFVPPPADACPYADTTPAQRPRLSQMSFSASPTTVDQGQCSTLTWSVENVQAVWVYPQGQPYQNYPRTGQGSEQVCPPVTTTYEMRVLQRDGTVTFQRATVTVRPAAVQNPLANTAWQVTGYYTGNNAWCRRSAARR